MVNFAKVQWTANVETPSNDRVLLLQAKGQNRPQDVKCRVKSEGSLWYCSYEKGAPPEPLKQRWTKASTAIEAIRKYYSKKDIEVIEET